LEIQLSTHLLTLTQLIGSVGVVLYVDAGKNHSERTCGRGCPVISL